MAFRHFLEKAELCIPLFPSTFRHFPPFSAFPPFPGPELHVSPKYQGPYEIIEVLPYHTYRVQKDGKASIQEDSCCTKGCSIPETDQDNTPVSHTLSMNALLH